MAAACSTNVRNGSSVGAASAPFTQQAAIRWSLAAVAAAHNPPMLFPQIPIGPGAVGDRIDETPVRGAHVDVDEDPLFEPRLAQPGASASSVATPRASSARAIGQYAKPQPLWPPNRTTVPRTRSVGGRTSQPIRCASPNGTSTRSMRLSDQRARPCDASTSRA